MMLERFLSGFAAVAGQLAPWAFICALLVSAVSGYKYRQILKGRRDLDRAHELYLSKYTEEMLSSYADMKDRIDAINRSLSGFLETREAMKATLLELEAFLNDPAIDETEKARVRAERDELIHDLAGAEDSSGELLASVQALRQKIVKFNDLDSRATREAKTALQSATLLSAKLVSALANREVSFEVAPSTDPRN